MIIEKLFKDFPSEEELLNIIMHTSTIGWDGELVERDIETWLSNFKGKVCKIKYERLLALWLLSHFTYYNESEVKHLCRVLYKDLLHFILKETTKPLASIEDTFKLFFSKSNIISAEETGGSGGFIAYIFRQENHLPIKQLFNFSLENISDKIENVIVIDDVTLTSGKDGQMYKFWEKAKSKYPKKNFYLLTLIATESSYEFLTKTFDLKIVTTVRLDNRDKCFANESDVFSSFPQLIPIAKAFAEYYGKEIGITDPLGYKDGQFTFGFYYNTPDNTLPIFWGQINNWIPVLRRYHKNYTTLKFLNHERFI